MNETKQTSESRIAVTGASGHLGRLVVEDLLARNFPANKIVAVARDPQKVADFAAREVEVRPGDYTKPETLDASFEGVERLLLISSNVVGERLPQHKNAVEAARKAGVKFIAYTSIPKADTNEMQLAGEHKETEQLNKWIPIAYINDAYEISK